MMKKGIKRGIIALLIFALIFVLGVSVYSVYKLEHYNKLTFNEVLTTRHDYYGEHYGIGNKKDPADYGFPNFTVYEYPSIKDHLRLNAWFVPAKKKGSKKSIVFIHGHHANRLRTMKYLALVRKIGMDKEYSSFFPDMRNSGLSAASSTAMGYRFAEDIAAGILFLNKKFGTREVIIYGFSMGAMGTLVMLDRPELYDALEKKGISIRKIIFDSPMCNVKRLIYHEAVVNKKMPRFVPDIGTRAFNIWMGGYLSRMRLSRIYRDISIPLLILQSEDDPATSVSILRDELKELHNPAVHVQFFSTGQHVRIFQNKKMRARYIETVRNFLRAGGGV